ncbi:MAG: ParB/RepB/Spo0J family partition protein [Candidatus Nanoarchaeia archaeon]|nr:ParB/RepB/Spo0J family partition protein [Candidatus Nanoarchaeia archaeon]
MKNMTLDEIPVDSIDIIPAFNIREEFGTEETRDLEESLKSTNGNIQPIIVCRKGDRYDLVSGERRLLGLKSTGIPNALVIIYDNLTDLQRTQLMFNENLGRKQLTWQEELKALKRLQSLGHEVDFEFLEKQQKVSKQKIWSLLEGLQAVEEYPRLLKEKTRKSCILKYRELKREVEGDIPDRKMSIKTMLDETEKLDSESMVIEELKEEIKHYQFQLENICETIKNVDKVERLSKGIWLADEIKQLIESARTCETFGRLEEKDTTCKTCKKDSQNVYAQCEFFRDEIGHGK